MTPVSRLLGDNILVWQLPKHTLNVSVQKMLRLRTSGFPVNVTITGLRYTLVSEISHSISLNSHNKMLNIQF